MMVLLKVSSLVAVLGLVVSQMSCTQAAPVRPGLDSLTDRVTLSDYEARRLLNALVKEFVQMTAEEMEQGGDGNNLDNRPVSKRCLGLSTCVTGKLSQDFHKYQYPRTNVGAGTPGKKRSVLGAAMDNEHYYGDQLDINN
ncbi:calcitonin gene-related peptide 2 isoform X1 [Rana temporaria]|uniref:calcitonin gene-related peptide 2 isoform X1 n=1 Tax=Rana temporaria TaxID=8407 RepID=UPI001AAD4D19|nr:calcitonin gene-related peptide 2 isoform X1 [Rana temporaria]XP_040183794.1 calcitonin gene-related peptide 2 isoform X1 [Rana temporaria]